LVLIDAGSGMSPWAQQLWRAAQQILLISTPDSVAVMDSYAAVKHSPWGDVDGKIRLVLNQCDAPAAGRATGQRFEATCQRFLGIRVVAPAVLATRSDIVATVTLPLDPDRAFRQSIRLLAADVMSDSLAMLGKASQKTSQETDAAPLKNRGAEKSLQNLQ
jgi:MinD-like ATPase involved in chromosome partitioning or flagellar assembly